MHRTDSLPRSTISCGECHRRTRKINMRILGWIYLGGYALDAGLSLLASYMPELLPASNFLSTMISVFTIVAFLLALFSQLAPQKLFLVLTGYYFLLLAFGFGLGILILAELGPQKAQGIDVNPQFLRQQFGWYEPVHLTLNLLWFCLAVYGLLRYASNKVNPEPDTQVMPETTAVSAKEQEAALPQDAVRAGVPPLRKEGNPT